MHFPKILDHADMMLFLRELKLLGGFDAVKSYHGTNNPEAWVIWLLGGNVPEVIYTWASLGYWVRNLEGVHDWPDALTHAEEYAERHVACNGR